VLYVSDFSYFQGFLANSGIGAKCSQIALQTIPGLTIAANFSHSGDFNYWGLVPNALKSLYKSPDLPNFSQFRGLQLQNFG